MNLTSDNHSTQTYTPKLVVLLIGVMLLAVYFLLRYGGNWGDNDSHDFTQNIYLVSESATILPPEGAYPNGYGFQALAISIIKISGIKLSDMQVIAAGLLVLWLVIPAWLLYRELTGSEAGAFLASSILFIQPEFLFLILRGTHEKFTRGLMFLSLYLIVRSLRSRREQSQFFGLLLACYLASFGLIVFNTFQATSFIFGLGVALGLTWIVINKTKSSLSTATSALPRLGFAVVIMMIMSFLFIFYIYPPAQHSLFVLESVSERLGKLFLDVQETVTGESYRYINFGWVSLPVYFMITLANWFTLLSSALIWLWWTWRWFRTLYEPQRLNEILLWSFYGAFTFLGFLSILVDISGTVIGNLQHRLFPTFIMLASPLIAWYLVQMYPGKLWNRTAFYSGLGGMVAVLALLSTFKATNEPIVSNKWTFFLPAERESIQWADNKIARDNLLWVSFDERMQAALGVRGDESLPINIKLDTYQPDPSTRDFLISDLTRKRSLRLKNNLPIATDDSITYDNGASQIYHALPHNPFQK